MVVGSNYRSPLEREAPTSFVERPLDVDGYLTLLEHEPAPRSSLGTQNNHFGLPRAADVDASIATEEAVRQWDAPVVPTSTFRTLKHRQFTNCGVLWTDQDSTSVLSTGSNESMGYRQRRPRLRKVQGQQSIWVQPRAHESKPHDTGNAAASSEAEQMVSCDLAGTEDPPQERPESAPRVSQERSGALQERPRALLRAPKSLSEHQVPKCPSCQDLHHQAPKYSGCRKSPTTLEIDRLLQSSDEDTQSVGIQKARQQQSKIEITLLMVCYHKGICEQEILQKMIDFFRIRFIVSYSDVHYCELCNVVVKTELLGSHLQYGHHCSLLASLAKGDTVLLSQEAIDMGKQRDECVSVSLSRFRVGLGIHGRFCSPLDVKLAKNLRQVSSLEFPEAFVKEMLPRHRSLWITPAEYNKMNNEYQQRKKRQQQEKQLDKSSKGPLLGSLALSMNNRNPKLSGGLRANSTLPNRSTHLNNGFRAPCQENPQGVLQDSTQMPSVGIWAPQTGATGHKMMNSARTNHARSARARNPQREFDALVAEDEFKNCCLGMARPEDSPSHTSMTGTSRAPVHSFYRPGLNLAR